MKRASALLLALGATVAGVAGGGAQVPPGGVPAAGSSPADSATAPADSLAISATADSAARAAAADSALFAEAALRLEDGRPVEASRLLARRLSSGAPAGPDLVLLTARAYADHRAWPAVRRLLFGQPWLEMGAEGEGLLLLARAYLALDSLSAAAAIYETYLGEPEAPAAEPAEAPAAKPPEDPDTTSQTDTGAGSAPPAIRAEARVRYAATLSRLQRHAEAAAQLEHAATDLPGVSGWVQLSALQARSRAGDTAAAARLGEPLLADPRVPPDSVQLELALAAFRAGDAARGVELAGEADRGVYDALAGEWIAPVLLAAGDTAAALDAYRRGLRAGYRGREAVAAVAAVDSSSQVLAELGEAERRAGRRDSGKRFLRRALEKAPADERAGLAETLAAAERADGRHTRAIAVLSPWLEGDGLTARRRASTWLLAGRSFLSLGQRRAAREALETAAAAGPYEPAAFASYLLADLVHDEGDIEGARAAYRSTAARFPRMNYGGLALVRLALLEFREGRFAEAAEEFNRYRRRFPRGRWYQGAIYWSGRARETSGDSAAARALYLETIGHDPLAYYAHLAGARTGVDPWEKLSPRAAAEPPLAPEHADLVERMDVLRRLGWDDRARDELRVERATGPQTPDRLLALALALNRSGWTWQGVRLAWQVRAMRQNWSEPLLRAVYPLPHRTALEEVSRARGLDPALVAGLVRRESLFDPGAVSVANAVGLMQLLPRTAQDVARRAGLPELRREQLVAPEVNILLGTVYLADMLDRFEGSSVAALISYNAGPHRYLRWRDFPEHDADRELFVERIPFRETRDYVKAVHAHTAIYRRLYGL